MSEQRQAEAPKSGYMLMAFDAIKKHGAMNRQEITLATGLGKIEAGKALSNCVTRGFLQRDIEKNRYEIAPAVVREACEKIEATAKKKAATKAARKNKVTIHLSDAVLARLDATVEQRKGDLAESTRSEIMRLALLAYTRPTNGRKAKKPRISRKSIAPAQQPAKWWRFWK